MAGHGISMLALLCIEGVMRISGADTVRQTSFGYGKSVLMDLCQYVGVQYIRNPDNPECGYIACWDRRPYHMPCAPGLKVHRLFFWGSSYPCTEQDEYGRCNYVKNFLMGDSGTSHRRKGNVVKSVDRSESAELLKEIKTGNKREIVHGAGNDLYEPRYPVKEQTNKGGFSRKPYSGYGRDTKRTIGITSNVLPLPTTTNRLLAGTKYGSQRPDFAPRNRAEYRRAEVYASPSQESAHIETKESPAGSQEVEDLAGNGLEALIKGNAVDVTTSAVTSSTTSASTTSESSFPITPNVTNSTTSSEI